MSTSTRKHESRSRALTRAAVAAVGLGAALGSMNVRAAVGPELQRPTHVARTVNGETSPPSRTPPSASPSTPPSASPSTSPGAAPADATVATRPVDLEDGPQTPRDWKHSGFILDGKIGMLGCLRSICSGAGGHAADPGVRVGGFLGGNVGGILEVGVQGAWGRLRADVSPDRNVLDLYGIDTAALQREIDQHAGGMADALGLDALDLDELAVRDAKLQSVQAGVGLRLHFVPRGRVDAWVGSGIGYELFRADYRTPSGDVRVDFHGLGVPAQAGLNVFLTRRLAIGADFEYRWTHFGVGNLQHPARDVAVPLSLLAERGYGAQNIDQRLPRFWTAGLSARLRV